MALGRSTRDQAFLNSFGALHPILTPVNGVERKAIDPHPNQDASANTHGTPVYYIALNPEMFKSYVQNPTNQGQRGGIAARQTMMFDPRNSPARSQISEGYTIPIQVFNASNAWETPSGQNTAGVVQRQPSTKFASPFSTPIATRMPWDL